MIRAAGHQTQARMQSVRKRKEKGDNTSTHPHMERSQEEEIGGWKQDIKVMKGAERIKIKTEIEGLRRG